MTSLVFSDDNAFEDLNLRLQASFESILAQKLLLHHRDVQRVAIQPQPLVDIKMAVHVHEKHVFQD